MFFIEITSRYHHLESYRKSICFETKTKKQKNDLLQGLFKLNMNSLYGVQILRENNESYYCKPENWMKTEFDENVSVYRKLPNGNYIVKMKKRWIR